MDEQTGEWYKQAYITAMNALQKAETERDFLADALLHIFLAHAVDSGTRPSSITSKAINEALGHDNPDIAALIKNASDRVNRQEQKLLDDLQRLITTLHFYMEEKRKDD